MYLHAVLGDMLQNAEEVFIVAGIGFAEELILGGLKPARRYFQISHNVSVTLIRTTAAAKKMSSNENLSNRRKFQVSFLLHLTPVCSSDRGFFFWNMEPFSGAASSLLTLKRKKVSNSVPRVLCLFSTVQWGIISTRTNHLCRSVVAQWAPSKSIRTRKARTRCCAALKQHQRPDCNEAGTNQAKPLPASIDQHNWNWHVDISMYNQLDMTLL